MPTPITHNDFTRWYQKINVLRKQNGINKATIGQPSSSDISNAARIIDTIDNINNARSLHSLLIQSSDPVSKDGISEDRIELEFTYNEIQDKLLALLKTCINVDNNTVVPQGCNQSTGNSYSTGNNITSGCDNMTGDEVHTGCNVHDYT